MIKRVLFIIICKYIHVLSSVMYSSFQICSCSDEVGRGNC